MRELSVRERGRASRTPPVSGAGDRSRPSRRAINGRQLVSPTRPRFDVSPAAPAGDERALPSQRTQGRGCTHRGTIRRPRSCANAGSATTISAPPRCFGTSIEVFTAAMEARHVERTRRPASAMARVRGTGQITIRDVAPGGARWAAIAMPPGGAAYADLIRGTTDLGENDRHGGEGVDRPGDERVLVEERRQPSRTTSRPTSSGGPCGWVAYNRAYAGRSGGRKQRARLEQDRCERPDSMRPSLAHQGPRPLLVASETRELLHGVGRGGGRPACDIGAHLVTGRASCEAERDVHARGADRDP